MTGVFSLYVPGDSAFHRLGVGWKYLLLLGLTLPAMLVGSPWVSSVLLIAALAMLAACRVPLGYSWRLPSGLWLLVAVMSGYQLVLGQWQQAVVIGANLLTAVYASRLLTMTTPGPVLIDALVDGLRPLRPLKVDPERLGLVVAVMIRSVPMLLDSFDQVRQAARARGQERNLLLLAAPVVVRAVGFAHATGAAMAARGLGDSEVST